MLLTGSSFANPCHQTHVSPLDLLLHMAYTCSRLSARAGWGIQVPETFKHKSARECGVAGVAGVARVACAWDPAVCLRSLNGTEWQPGLLCTHCRSNRKRPRGSTYTDSADSHRQTEPRGPSGLRGLALPALI
mmetsp:Transcript_84877/g.203437  ORF Transcript_84877/g.203437 Transcript_84877/m.203437 type:complete len:133 (+) Transcript_84877:58-456(+)